MNDFEIKINPNQKLIPVVLSSINEYAKNFFDNQKEINKIVLATEEAINNVLEYSVTERMNEIKITVDANDGEFVVCIYDKGMPGDYEETLKGEDKIGLTLMHAITDQAFVQNLGNEGRLQKLVKYYCRIPNFKKEVKEIKAPEIIEGAEITVKTPNKNEMLDVCRAFYNEYGLTYLNDIVYYPDRFYAAVAKDQMHSTIAVDQNGNFAGHHCTFEWEKVPGVWESGMAIVNSNYRNAGVFKKMMARSYNYVHDDAKGKIFLGECVMTHEYSQKLRLRYGSFPVSFYFNMGMPNIGASTFKSDSDYTSGVIAASAFDFTPKTVYLSEELHEAANYIYNGLGLERTILTDFKEPELENSRSTYFFHNYSKSGSININEIGKDYKQHITNNLRELKSKGADSVMLYFTLENPSFSFVYEAAKELGFFFTGIIPNADQGDVVTMEKLLQSVVNYEANITISPFTELFEMVRKFDPEQNVSLLK